MFFYICECLHTDGRSLAIICHIFRLLFHDLSPHVHRIIGDHGEHSPHIQPSVSIHSQRSWQTVADFLHWSPIDCTDSMSCDHMQMCTKSPPHFCRGITVKPPNRGKIVTRVSAVSRKGKQTRHVRGKTQREAVICCLLSCLREIKYKIMFDCPNTSYSDRIYYNWTWLRRICKNSASKVIFVLFEMSVWRTSCSSRWL